MSDLDFEPIPGTEKPLIIGRALLWLILLWLLVRFATHSVVSNYAGASFLHLPNLVFHEAGHILFGFFPRFLTVLGGSATQVLIPLVCLVALWRHGDRFGASVALWWVGQNFVDLAPYINDARDLQLVLLGGHTGQEVEGHDWEYLLQATHLSTWDHTLARLAHLYGIAVMLGALVWGAYEIRRSWRRSGSMGSTA
jgi:hypothetical protein